MNKHKIVLIAIEIAVGALGVPLFIHYQSFEFISSWF